MLRWIYFFVFFILISFSGTSQFQKSPYSGIWIYRNASTGRPVTITCPNKFDKKIYQYPGLKGILAIVSWRNIQPAAPNDTSSPFYSSGGFNWNYIDSVLLEIAKDTNLSIGVMVWTGEDAPDWLHNNEYNIGECFTDGDNACGYEVKKSYPDYFNPSYKELWYKMIDSVINHLNNGPDSDEPDKDDDNPFDYRNKIVFYQACEGSTGDLDPQKGSLQRDAAKYCSIDRNTWLNEIVKPAWLHTYNVINKYKSNLPNIHLLVNTGQAGLISGKDLDNGESFNSPDDFVDPNSPFQFAKEKLPGAWRKAEGPGHYYQLNYEIYTKPEFDKLNNTDKNGVAQTPVITRDEYDLHQVEIPTAYTAYNFFASATNALHFGLDIWLQYYDQLYLNDSLIDPLDTLTSDDYINPADKWITDFFNKNADENPLTAVNSFCALRDGLDAGDYNRFSKKDFSPNGCKANSDYKIPNRFIPPNDPDNLTCGAKRTLNIQAGHQSSGALQRDAPAAQGAPLKQRNVAIDVNDVGWYIQPGNYERFLTQINPSLNNTTAPFNNTSVGYWNKIVQDNNPDDTNYNNLIFGRFARGFDFANKKNAFYFNIDDNFLLTAQKCLSPFNNASKGYGGEIKITYLDAGFGSFTLYYDAAEKENLSSQKSFPPVIVGNTNNWITKTFPIPCGSARFENGCLNMSDFYIKNTGERNTIFTLVEFSTTKTDSIAERPKINTAPVEILISPNPIADFYTIQLKNKELINSISIYNTLGREVSRQIVNNKIAYLYNRNPHLTPGIYFVFITYSGNKHTGGKLLAQ